MAERAQKIVGVSMMTLEIRFHRDLKAGLERAAAELGLGLDVSVAEFRAADQAITVARLAARRAVDAIVVTPCHSSSIGIAIEQANRHGIPVFTMDVASTGGRGKVVSHVASDNLDGGRRAAELMVQALGGKGRVVTATHPGVTSMSDRVRGFKEVLARNPGIEVVGEVAAWTDPRKESAALIEPILRRTPVDGIFGANDDFAMGALAAVERAGKLGQVKIVGYDGSEEVKAEIRRGRIHGDVVQHPEAIAALALRAVHDHLAGKVPPAFIPAEQSLYTAADARAGR